MARLNSRLPLAYQRLCAHQMSSRFWLNRALVVATQHSDDMDLLADGHDDVATVAAVLGLIGVAGERTLAAAEGGLAAGGSVSGRPPETVTADP